MTLPPDPATARARRHSRLAIAALVAVPVAVVVTTGASAGLWSSGANLATGGTAPGAATPTPAVTTTPTHGHAVITASVNGRDAGWDLSAVMPQVTVSLPPEPSPTPEPVPQSPSGNDGSGGTPSRGSTDATPPSSDSADTPAWDSSGELDAAPPTRSRDAYCASPDGAASASSSQGMLSAANVERARIGVAPLSWSGSLAQAATSWSASMAAQDSSTAATMDALAHNPSRPAGGENVAVSYSSAGQPQSAAAASAHSGWVYSYGHCMNMLNPQYSVMGAGMAVTDDGTTWYSTANFQ